MKNRIIKESKMDSRIEKMNRMRRNILIGIFIGTLMIIFLCSSPVEYANVIRVFNKLVIAVSQV